MFDRNNTMDEKNSKIQKQHLADCRDWIDDLPDCLLLHILSLLQTHDAFRTSFVSKRWRNLWYYIPSLDFSARKHSKIVPFINKVVSLHQGSKIHRFHASLDYRHSYASTVDSWIHFAVKRNVVEFGLALWFRGFGDLYRLPSCLFNSRSLQSLELRQCDLHLHGPVCLNSLKTLILDMVVVDDVVIQTLVSGSPLLERLDLFCCVFTSDLTIFDPTGRLRSVKIVCFSNVLGGAKKIDIQAPNLLSLEFSGFMPEAGFRFKSSTALNCASFNFEIMLDEDYGGSNHWLHLLDDVRHAKVVRLCKWCLQASVILEKNSMVLPSLNALHLELRSSLTIWEFQGIVYLLKASSYIESLMIVIDHEICFNTRKFLVRHLKLQEFSFACELQHLKTVNICGFISSEFTSFKDHQSEEAYGKLHYLLGIEIRFMKFLLKNSKALEGMTINSSHIECFQRFLRNSELLNNLYRKLLAFPRASSKAKIYFS